MVRDAQKLSPYRTGALYFSREVLLGAALMIGVAALIVLNSPSRTIALAPFALLGLLVVLWCARLATFDPRWLIFALALEETLPYMNLIPVDPESRWWLRYPLLLALCLPAIPAVWRSGWLRRGGFKALSFYFAWAALTIAWSLAPGVSAGRLVPDVLLFVALALVVESMQEPQDMENLFGRFLVGCGILLALIALTAVVFPVNIFREGEDPAIGVYNWFLDDAGILRFSGIFSATNELGSLAVATAGAGFCYLCIAGVSRGRARLAVLGCIAASLVFAMMADSRSALFAIAVGLGSYSIWRYRARGLALCAVVIVAAALGFMILGGSQNAYFDRGAKTLTGRTEAWQFEIEKLQENPILGYGYGVEGAIFEDRYFPLWENFWNRGANTPLHNGYLSVAIGLGLPALLVWIIVFMRPWIAAFRRPHDPWNLKPLFFLVVVPMLLIGLDETGVAEPRYLKGLLLLACWMIAERQRILSLDQMEQARYAPERRMARLLAGTAAILMLASAGAVAVSGAARAADYYVESNAGNDASAGTSAALPWRSLAKVDRYEFHPGDIVHLRRGSMWREVLAPDATNHANFRGVSFEAYGSGGNPTINGSDALSGWVRSGQATYAVREPARVYNVFVDGQPGWGLMGACCLASSSCAASPQDPPVRDQTCVIGPMQPGSWYWSGPSATPPAIANTFYVWLPDGGDPATHLVEAVTRPIGVHGWVQSNQLDSLTIDGLRIIQTGLRGISLESEERAGRLGNGRGVSGLIVRNCIVERTGTGPVDDGSYGNGIAIINATAPLIENNRVSHCGNHGNCVNVQNANGARILNNNVDHWNHNGIDVKGYQDVVVMGNVVAEQRAIGAAYYVEYCRDVTFENNRAQAVHNGFQISDESSARILNNFIDSAGSGVYLGPHAVSLSLSGNSFSHCYEDLSGDGSGIVVRDGVESHPAASSGHLFDF